MEGRDVPAVLGDPTIAIASYNGATDATAQLLDTTNDSTRVRVAPFAGFRGELSVSAGDVNGDGVADAIVGAQAPDGHVKVFDGTSGALLQSFFAFAGFNGAVNVGTADVNGDGFADVLVTAGAINGHVKAFSGQNGAPVSSFFAFPGFYGQTSISGADFDHDGRAEIIVGAGAPGVGGHVALFHGDGSVFNPGVFAFPGFGGTVSVASGDVNGDGTPDIVVGAGRGAPGGQVKVFSGTDFSVIGSFLPYAPGVTNGVNVQLADPNQDGGLDIIVTMQGGGFPSVSKFAGTSGYRLALLLSDPDTSDADYTAYYDSSWYTTPDTSYTPPDTSYYYDPGPSYDPWWSYDPWSGYYDPGPSYTPPDTSYTPPDTSYSDPWYYDPGPSYDPGYTSPDYGGGGDFDSDDYGGGGDF
jgi:hypothetical protein